MSLLTATRLSPVGLRATSSLRHLPLALPNAALHPIPTPPPSLSIRSLQSAAATATEVRPRTRHAPTCATSAAVAAGRAHSTLMSNLSIPSSEHATGLKHGSRVADVRAHSNTTALRPDVAQKEEGQFVVGGGRGAEGAYNVNPEHEVNDLLSSSQGAWTLMNPIYTNTELDSVKVVERTPQTLSDKAAHGIVKILRRTFDLFTGYIAKDIPKEVLAQRPIPVAELRAKNQVLSDKQWLLRIILLESIAGVPGMVAGTLRHLRSLRLMRRDGGWIHTLLEEAENERMHLLTFLTVSQPTLFTRALVLAAQGVFYNVFFLTYLFAPKTAHRFVGALEEEAVRTYTHCIEDMQHGLLPEWDNKPAPQIAIDYWRMSPDATLFDVIRAVRADEATHRFVNHSLANLDQKHDFNPFALAEASPEVRGSMPGFTREESAEFARQTQQKLLGPAAEKDSKKMEPGH
ncbi:uncharacterized protein CcaverHIS019_0105610 [Cutaneotrichosporon cavernicola]|uniref:Alternative oxidase n=1 Tax=Cutaneotrichosporon cavernicola TaxID=279322 RepID=A0AA48IHY9_9TREE|nr:uncharacterized protein CcaverHIS019_0105610 [Cutaneotrichosporon cavernicola]BEI87843.1 hypothetical protein CcaverHIS019_0105610 [Cutaneotrichosporon cavernicola]BEI95617.1 hypothetical protein CcaverHIS631_0105660 [Cutaneotrichosporon cavernicola]BEJ03392.1 hypothetical protein CcaverHIS641_0105670 [Cutaneotrichosporon cavernicola]